MDKEEYYKYFMSLPKEQLASELVRKQDCIKDVNVFRNHISYLKQELCEKLKEIKLFKKEKKNLIKYLEDKIEEIKMTYSQINGDYGYMNDRLEVYEEILDKVKEGKYE